MWYHYTFVITRAKNEHRMFRLKCNRVYLLRILVTVRNYSYYLSLFATIRIIRTIRYSLFATIRYPLFWVSRHPKFLIWTDEKIRRSIKRVSPADRAHLNRRGPLKCENEVKNMDVSLQSCAIAYLDLLFWADSIDLFSYLCKWPIVDQVMLLREFFLCLSESINFMVFLT